MPNFADVETASVISSKAVDNSNNNANNDQDTFICPLLMKHYVYPMTNKNDPTITVHLFDKSHSMLLDTGAHVSVLPKSLLVNEVDLTDQGHKGRWVKAFGGQQLKLDGPVCVQIHICGLHMVHPFYHIDADIPPIGGYDLMRAAKLIIDASSAEVWSKHPDAAQSMPWPGRGHESAKPDNLSHRMNPLVMGNGTQTVTHPTVKGNSTLTSCDIEDNTSGIEPDTVPADTDNTTPKALDPNAAPFQPLPRTLGLGNQDTDTDMEMPDDLPDHINLLYETTVHYTKLTHDEDRHFKELLFKHKDTFAKNSTDLGFCSALQHDIDTGDSPPIKQSPRRPPLSAGNAENEIIEEMLQAHVIEPSLSEWASPVCLVKKPDDTYRFCIDYRRVNAVSRKDGFPIPDINEAIDSLRGASWFCTIDLLAGYWQLGLTQRAKERSAFCTRRGLYQFCRMPFGLCGAPATFCRLMSLVLGDLVGKICLCYLDDIIVFAKTKTELLDRLDQIFTRLHEFGLKIKPSKCVLFRTEIQFLGHLITASGVQPLPDKVAAIRDWPTPRCLRDTRAFYGLIGYYRRFIAGFATLAEPLTRLTKKGTKFVWTQETDDAFRKLKQAMLEVPTLTFPFPNRPCILDTDSSDVSYGSVISQVIEGTERPIAYFSRVMTQSQQNYCATRRELLAVIASLQHFRHYLLNVPVILRTDHFSLKWLRTFKRPEGILARWLETLSEFQITIEHRPGRVHSNADGLSRQTCKQCWGRLPKAPWVDELGRANECAEPLGIHALHLLPELSDDTVHDLQCDDPIIGPVRSWLDLQYEPSIDDLRQLPPDGRKLWSQHHSLSLSNNVLVRNADDKTYLVVPETLRRRLFDQAHCGPLAAHLGSERTLAQLRTAFYWPGMSKDIQAWCQSCDTCARSRGPPPRARAPMTKVIASAPLDMVAIDILSGLPAATDGSTCMLVVTDYMTKWAEAYALPNEEAHTCMTALYTGFFARFGFPAQIHSDQGRNFESRLVAELTKLAGIRRTRTTPFHPRSDGQTERLNRTILHMLRTTAHDHPETWPEKLPTIMSAYRMTPHKTTGTTPNCAMLGREVATPCSLIAAPPEEVKENLIPYNATFRDNMREAHQRVRDATKIAAKTQKTYFDARVKAISLRVGQLVWLFWPRPQARQQAKKLTHLWVGPYKITEFKSEVVVVVQHLKTGKSQTVHVDRLVPCHSVSEIINPPKQLSSSSPQQVALTSTHESASDGEHQISTEPQSSVDRTQSYTKRKPTVTPTRRSERAISRPVRYRQ